MFMKRMDKRWSNSASNRSIYEIQLKLKGCICVCMCKCLRLKLQNNLSYLYVIEVFYAFCSKYGLFTVLHFKCFELCFSKMIRYLVLHKK